VVVATLDTGANLFHPTWIRNQSRHPSEFIAGFPADALPIDLTRLAKYTDSVNASLSALKAIDPKEHFYWVPGTNIIGAWAHPTDTKPIFDWAPEQRGVPGSNSHGSQASSQIAGAGYSLAPDAWIVVMDRTNDGTSGVNVYHSNADGLRWAADQPWIDVIHTNIQNPLPMARTTPLGDANAMEGYPAAVRYAVAKGKLVVSAGGNFFVEATETSPHAGPSGVLVAGANDNCGYTDFSNPDPHVVMDGQGTVSASPNGFGNGTFGGTSSASPRISGYAAKLILEVRRAVNYTAGMQEGAFIVLDAAHRPSSGPLSDGRLTAAEVHEVIRKTADPNPHASKFDGAQGANCVPQPAKTPAAVYAKMGYGEVSEHTLPNAIDVILGKKPMPVRTVEDQFYTASEQVRQAAWAVG
jgi:hypothetical protein